MLTTSLKTVANTLAIAVALGAAAVATAGKLDLATPEGVTLAMRKVQCSLKDNVPVTYYWHGGAYSRVPGEPDRRLFNVEGMNIRQCVTVTDPVRGTGWKMVSKELLIYLDPKTNEVLKTWANPWTGKTLQVMQTANDPVNQPASFPKRRDGSPAEWNGTVNDGMWWMTATIPLFYDNPLQGKYQKYVGGTYHATEMFNFMGDVADLVDDRKDTASTRVGWVRVSSWLPWMEMGDRAGSMYFHTAGRKLAKFDDMSAVLKGVIASDYPTWREPPPSDDTRPNQTSWTVFRDAMETRAEKTQSGAERRE